MGRILDEIHRRWNSDDPQDNATGFLGKFLFEAALFFLGALVVGVAAGIAALIAGMALDSAGHPIAAGSGIITVVWVILLRNRLCSVIRRDATDDES